MAVKVMNISKKKFKTLEPLKLSREIRSTEAQLFYFDVKQTWLNERKLFKKLYIDEGEIFGNKLETINNLIYYSDVLEKVNFVLPEKFVSIGQNMAGFYMPFIKGENLSLFLKDYGVSSKDKVSCLRQIGECLEQLSTIRKYSSLREIHIGDLHEQNMVVDQDNNVQIVDLDSCKISGNQSFPSRYLITNHKTSCLPKKYPQNDSQYLITEETDLLSYNMMVLNYLAKGEAHRLNIEDYFAYLSYLDLQGVNIKLLESFSRVYLPVSNTNPQDFLEDLEEENYKTSLTYFQKVYNRQR